MNAFTKTEYNWDEAYKQVINLLEHECDFDTTKRVQEDAGKIQVSKFLDYRAYGDSSANQLATLFFDLGKGMTYNCFLRLDDSEKEGFMLRLMEIKLAISLVHSYERAADAFEDWKVGDHDT